MFWEFIVVYLFVWQLWELPRWRNTSRLAEKWLVKFRTTTMQDQVRGQLICKRYDKWQLPYCAENISNSAFYFFRFGLVSIMALRWFISGKRAWTTINTWNCTRKSFFRLLKYIYSQNSNVSAVELLWIFVNFFSSVLVVQQNPPTIA